MASADATASPTLPPGLGQARAQAGQFWQARAPRERQLILAAAMAVAVLLVWMILVQPALQSLRETPDELARLDQQMQQLRLAANEIQSLRAASPVPTEQATIALRAATERLGEKSRLAVQGDRATVSFTGVPAEALRAWLGEARSAARARPLEAQLTKSTAGYTGSITVTLGGPA